MKIGLFGGSFDPFHNGHMSMIEGALKHVDHVIVIPSARNAFKRGRILNPAPYRFYMASDAVARFGDRVSVSDVEFRLPGISYTYNTLRALSDEHKYDELYWICGSDILPTFDKWYKPSDILKLCKLLVAARPGQDQSFMTDIASLEKRFDTKIKVFAIDGFEVSSSAFRGSPKSGDVPPEVNDFIVKNALYSSPWLSKVSDEAFTEYLEYAIELYKFLGRDRLLHTLNVAVTSVKYAVMYGADPDKALIAGVLHDCAKELPDPKQQELCLIDGDPSYDNRKLWHGPAGAVFAREHFHIVDDEILDAIRYHTTGCGHMTTLDKVVYLADKIEPARTYADLTEVRSAADNDLDEGVRLSLKAFVEKFRRKGLELHPNTEAFLSDLGMKM